jgi:hypothetical protein
MADIEIGGPPGLQPVALQLPYAADPGTLTEWLLRDTAREPAAAVLKMMKAVTTQYANLPPSDEDDHMERVEAMSTSILGSDDLSLFLTVTTLAGSEVSVSVISGMSRYNVGLGAVSAFGGKTFGFFGEFEDGQLPPLLQLPGDLKDCIAPLAKKAPTAETLDAYYAVAQDSALLPLQTPATSDEVSVPRLQYLPKAWAPYFMAAGPPENALKVARTLVNQLPIGQQDDAAPLLNWCKAACVREGNGNVQNKRSQLDVKWETPATATDRRVVKWASRILQPFRSEAAAPAQQPMMPPMAMALPPPLLEVKETKTFTDLEHLLIRLACGLDPAAYDMIGRRPAIYAAMLTEGRTMSKLELVLQQYLSADPYDPDPVVVYASQELIKDVKDLRFGYNGDLSYASCHRGISPFAVLTVPMETQAKRRKVQERASRATFLSTMDVQTLEADPGICPSTYHGLRDLLRKYMKFLSVMFGDDCQHLQEIKGIHRSLGVMVSTYEAMSPDLVVTIVWQIFIDARSFFSHRGPGRAESQLSLLRMYITSCSITAAHNCPKDQLLGYQQQSYHHQLPPVISPSASHAGSSGSSLSSGSARFPPGYPPSSHRTQPHVNTKPIPALVSVMQKFREKQPGISMADLLRSEGVKFSDATIGPFGTCLDYAYFGKCDTPDCTYKHDASSGLGTAKTNAMVKKMEKTISSYLARNAS